MPTPDDSIEIHLESVRVKRPADVIIEQISGLITSGVLKPGQRLPSERVLTEKFEVGRAHVREALHKLELYGVVRTHPQSGTYIEKIGVPTLERLIGTILGIDELTPYMLTEVRGVLEVFAAGLACQRATDKQIGEIRSAYENQVKMQKASADTLEADFLFHIRLADATDNVLLRSLIGLMRTDVMRFGEKHRTASHGRAIEALGEHKAILDAIEAKDISAAEKAMRLHMGKSLEQYQI